MWHIKNDGFKRVGYEYNHVYFGLKQESVVGFSECGGDYNLDCNILHLHAYRSW